MRTSDFDFVLPPELIAQCPCPERDQSRLLVYHRQSGGIEHRRFHDVLEYLKPGDALVLNDSRVIPARLRGANIRTGGQFELLLLEENAANDWWVMLRPGKRGRVGTRIALLDPAGSTTSVHATVLATNAEGHRRVRFEHTPDVFAILDQLGEVPLPPYIRRGGADDDSALAMDDRSRYQTVYANAPGSVAAPTAGLHFTERLLQEIRDRGIRVCFVTLHVGLGTFAPVKTETVSAHPMHDERYELADQTVRVIDETKACGRRVVAVGTTTIRVLETVAAQTGGTLKAGRGRTGIFIYPPYDFKVADALLTNFHLPRSTLIMLVSAFADPKGLGGRQRVLTAYAEAIARRYRFFSYGDAMLVL